MQSGNFIHSGEKLCLCCGKSVYGRSDKKFCDDYCRNTYNNQLKSVSNNFVRRINNVLLKNRKILENLLSETGDMVKVPEEKLLSMGFQPRYHTHTYTTKKGQQYLFCYEYGYLEMSHKWYLLVKRKEAG